MTDTNLILTIIIAIILTLSVGFFEALIKEVTTGIYDYGYLISLFIYSLFVGVLAGYTGLLDLNMPLADWSTVLMGVFAQYFLYLTALHAVADYLISKILVTQPQGLATPFLKKQTLQNLAMFKPLR